MKFQKNLLLLSVFISLLLSGCNPENSKKHSNDTSSNNTISGLLAKGPIENSTVEIRRLDTNVLLASTTTNDKGRYEVSIGSYTGAVSISSNGGKYIDEIDGDEKDATDIILKAISVVSDKKGFIVNITPFTSIAVKKLEELKKLNNKKLSNEDIENENEKIAKIFIGEDFDITKITPKILGKDTIKENNNESKYGLLLASFAKLTNSDASKVHEQIKQLEKAIIDNALLKKKKQAIKETLEDERIKKNIPKNIIKSIKEVVYNISIPDTKAPTLSISDNQANTLNNSNKNIVFTFTFSEDVTGFDINDILITNASKRTFKTTNANTYTLLATADDDIEGNITISISSTDILDISNNALVTSPTITYTQAMDTRLVDTKAPTLSISDNRIDTISNSNKNITFTFTFSEDVTGFDINDILITNASKRTFKTTNANTYTLLAIANDDIQGEITLSISSTDILDISNNALVTSPTITYTQAMDTRLVDTKAPTLSISDNQANTLNNSNKNITFTFTFSEDVTGFDINDILITYASKRTFKTTNANTYTLLAIANDDIQGEITLSISSTDILDISNNALVTSPTITYTQSIDTKAPTLSISDNQANTLNNSNKNITFTFTFSEDVKNFTKDYIAITNATKGVFTKVSNKEYTLLAIADDEKQGEITLNIASSSNILDISNNALVTSPTITYTQSIDTKAPTLSISDNQANTLNNSNKNITFTFTFSEDVKNFTKDYIAITNATKGAFTKVSNKEYTLLAIADDEKQGEITLNIASSSNILDISNNALVTSPTITYTQSIDTKAPTLSITSHTNNQNIYIQEALNLTIRGASNENGKNVEISYDGKVLGNVIVTSGTWSLENIKLGNKKYRYVRVYQNGSNVGLASAINEVKIFNNETNIALKKPFILSNYLTNEVLLEPSSNTGTIQDGNYITGTSVCECPLLITIDLESSFTIDKIHVWRHYIGGRAYKNTDVKVSKDGIHWYSAFNSSNGGEYAETIAGKEITSIPISPPSSAKFTLKITDDIGNETIKTLDLNIGLALKSSSLKEDDVLANKYAYDPFGRDNSKKNSSPQLTWKAESSGTHSYAIIMDDTTVGTSNWIHWNVFNIPASITSLAETWSSSHDNANSDGIQQRTAQRGGVSFPINKYIGPWPPPISSRHPLGITHTYQIKVYALKSTMPILNGTDLAINTLAFENRYGDHILDSSTLNFKYSNP